MKRWFLFLGILALCLVQWPDSVSAWPRPLLRKSVTTGGAGSSSTCDAHTIFYLKSNTTNGSQLFQDTGGGSNCPHSIEVNGNVNHSTSQFKFGTTSIYCDGVNDYLRVYSSQSDWSFGLGDFTVDIWLYSSSGYFLVGNGYNLANKWSIRRSGLSKLIFTYAGGSEVISTSDIPTNAWVLLSVERYSGTLYMYMNGVKDASTANLAAINFNVDADLYIGADQNQDNDYTGYQAEIRISDIARYQGVGFSDDLPTTFFCQ